MVFLKEIKLTTHKMQHKAIPTVEVAAGR